VSKAPKSKTKPCLERKQKGTLSLRRYSKKRGGYGVQTKTGTYRGIGGPMTIHPGEDLRAAAIRTLGQATRKLSDIKVGKRHRKDYGDLKALARSIDARGLLQPIVITPQNKLIAGDRRMRAWPLTKFAKTPIPVTVVDIDSIVAGEWDENAIRKDFTPSEAVAIKRELEPALKAEAKRRQQQHGGTTRGRKAAATEGAGKSRDKVAAYVGKRARSLAKAEDIVEAAEADPKKFGKLKADMDRTGRVNGPHKRLQIMKQAEQIRKAPPGVPMKGPYGVVVIDFPWPNEPGMSQEELDARGRSLRPYPAMSIKSGCAFMRDKVRKILAKDCFVYFWATNFHAPYAWHLLAALGFKKHSTIGCWRKHKMGRGQVLRDKTELCIIAIKGKPVINLTNQTTDWSGPGWERRDNSQKPVAFYELVEELTPAPRYAEIFSRGGRNSKWDCHGDEIGKYPPGYEVPLLPMPIAESPARPADDFPWPVDKRGNSWPSENGHTVSMTSEPGTGNDISKHVGTCECGQKWSVPHGKMRDLDLIIGEHWLAEYYKAKGAPAPAAIKGVDGAQLDLVDASHNQQAAE